MTCVSLAHSRTSAVIWARRGSGSPILILSSGSGKSM
jgi:hypothetical protein